MPTSILFLMMPRPPRSTLFPYTTLFRSGQARRLVHDAVARRGSREDRPEGRRGSGRDGGRSHERRPGAARQRSSGPHLSSISAARSQATPPRPRARGAGRPSPLGGVMPFVHLHTHSEYSLLDGANRIPDLLDRVRALGMDSLAVTDHGNLHGAWQFYIAAQS